MLPPYMAQPYTSGNYLTEQSMRGANYPFSVANPAVSPWGTTGPGDVYLSTNATQTMEPTNRHRRGLGDWINTLDVVDGTLVITGICLTVLFAVSMVVELFRDVGRWVGKQEKEEKKRQRAKQGNFIQRIFNRSPRPRP